MALSEYEASIEDGSFVKPVEYQDSRGFVLRGRAHVRGRRGRAGQHRRRGARQDPRRVRQAQGGVARAHAARRARASSRARCRRWSPTSSCTSRGIDAAPGSASHCERPLPLAGRVARSAGWARSAPACLPFTPPLAPPRKGRGTGCARRAHVLRFIAACVLGSRAGSVALWPAQTPRGPSTPRDPFAALKARFARPTFVPSPAGQPAHAGQDRARQAPVRGQGAVRHRHHRLRLLPRSQALVHATANPRGKGVTGKRLVRHTPTLWNVAFSPLLFWDGRAASLEEQVRFPVEHPDEMGDTLDNAVAPLRAARELRARLRRGLPGRSRDLARATSPGRWPPTSARWCRRRRASTDGLPATPSALSPSEINGLQSSPARAAASTATPASPSPTTTSTTSACPATTRAAAPRSTCAPPTMPSRRRPCASWPGPRPTCTTARSARWTTWCASTRWAACDAPTRSKDLPRNLRLTDAGARRPRRLPGNAVERDAAAALARGLGRAEPDRAPPPPPKDTTVVSQANKLFAPAHVRLGAGQTLTVLNDDTRTHNVRIYDPRSISTPAPRSRKESVTIRFPVRRHLRGLLRHPSVHAAAGGGAIRSGHAAASKSGSAAWSLDAASSGSRGSTRCCSTMRASTAR